MVNVMKYANDGIRRSIAISIFFPEVMFLSLLAIQLRARSLHRNTVAEGKIQAFCLGKISTMIRLLSQCCFFFLCYPVFEPLQIRIYLVFRKEKEYIFVQRAASRCNRRSRATRWRSWISGERRMTFNEQGRLVVARSNELGAERQKNFTVCYMSLVYQYTLLS